jgi:hypothetical protein
MYSRYGDISKQLNDQLSRVTVSDSRMSLDAFAKINATSVEESIVSVLNGMTARSAEKGTLLKKLGDLTKAMVSNDNDKVFGLQLSLELVELNKCFEIASDPNGKRMEASIHTINKKASEVGYSGLFSVIAASAGWKEVVSILEVDIAAKKRINVHSGRYGKILQWLEDYEKNGDLEAIAFDGLRKELGFFARQVAMTPTDALVKDVQRLAVETDDGIVLATPLLIMCGKYQKSK